MSDENKIIRVTDLVAPVGVDDFGERVANAVESASRKAPPMTFKDIPRASEIGEVAQKPVADKRKWQPWTTSIGVAIPAGQVITTQQVLQVTFKAKQMQCASEGGRVYIRNIFVGSRVQLMQWNESGMRVDFLKDKINVDFDVCDPGLYITVQLENRGSEPANFDMTLFGEAAS